MPETKLITPLKVPGASMTNGIETANESIETPPHVLKFPITTRSFGYPVREQGWRMPGMRTALHQE